MEKKFYNQRETLMQLGVSRYKLGQLVKDGSLSASVPSVVNGRLKLYARADVDRLAHALAQARQEEPHPARNQVSRKRSA